jgi:glycosyltransferase involved in cell wall biosynthesis
MFTERSSWKRKAFVLTAEAIASQFGDLTFSVNQDDIAYLRALPKVIGRQNVRYLGNACDLELFNPTRVSGEEIAAIRARWQVPKDALVIGMVGRLVREKGCMEFISAAHELAERYPACEFVIVGPHDPYKPDGVDPSQIGAKVKAVGYETDMPSAYAAIDIMVLPSHREGFPRSLVEACAMGKPIVTTDTRGCREAVDPGRNGLLVPVADAQALTLAIERLINDAAFRYAAGSASREKALREFSIEKLVERLVYGYRECLNGTNSPARSANR